MTHCVMNINSSLVLKNYFIKAIDMSIFRRAVEKLVTHLNIQYSFMTDGNPLKMRFFAYHPFTPEGFPVEK